MTQASSSSHRCCFAQLKKLSAPKSQLQATLALREIAMMPEKLVRPYKMNLQLLEKWEATCNEVNADNFENAKTLVSTTDCAKKVKEITKGMILLKQLTDGVRRNSGLLQG